MKPLYPAIFHVDKARNLQWADLPENHAFYCHIVNTCKDFPSLILAWSASEPSAAVATEIADDLLKKGINVFMPAQAAPVCALSQALGNRGMPLGLYLAVDENDNCSLTAMTNHGGLFDQQDVLGAIPPDLSREGILGVTDLERDYVNQLAGFADKFLEVGRGFRSFRMQFSGIAQKLRSDETLAVLFEPDEDGPDAEVGADGQSLKITHHDGSQISTIDLVETLAEYLIKDRLAAGTMVGPLPHPNIYGSRVELSLVEGSVTDMHHQAAFSDLLMGWWSDGTIAHQGNSCFGDGILSAIYYLEACRNK